MRITALFCLLLATSFAMAEDRPPNILLIMADDLGADCLPVYGNTIYSTPHLDRLAGEGAVFENAYATPVCSPTRSMIMTGLYPNRTGILERMDSPADRKNHNNRLPAHIKTFGHLFKEAGYATAIAGKWHLGHSEELYPQGQGATPISPPATDSTNIASGCNSGTTRNAAATTPPAIGRTANTSNTARRFSGPTTTATFSSILWSETGNSPSWLISR